jgi:molecular chaperone HscA
MARMLRDSLDHAEDDMLRRLLIESRVDAKRAVAALKSAIAVDGDLLDASERAGIEAALAKTESAVAGEDRAAIESAVEQLEAVALPFAERRMDRGIRKALAGKTLAELDGPEKPAGDSPEESRDKDRAAR